MQKMQKDSALQRSAAQMQTQICSPNSPTAQIPWLAQADLPRPSNNNRRRDSASEASSMLPRGPRPAANVGTTLVKNCAEALQHLKPLALPSTSPPSRPSPSTSALS